MLDLLKYLLCVKETSLKMLHDVGLLATKPASSPTDLGCKLDIANETLLPNPTKIRSLIDKLLYLTHFIPDITFIVTRLSQYLAIPNNKHMLAAIRILKYIKNMPTLRLHF